MRLLTVVALVLTVSLGHAKHIDEPPVTGVQGQLAVVTGGARGIGYAVVEELLKNGARLVVIVDKNRSVGEKAKITLSHKYGIDKVFFVHADVTIDLDRVIRLIWDTWGCPDILMNNAGVLNEKDTKLTIETNLIAPIDWSLTFLDRVRKDKGGKGGVIVNMADAYYHIKDPFVLKYKAAYSGLASFSEALGHLFNFEKTNVKVFAICPGFTKTKMTEGQMEIDERADIFDRYSLSWKWQSAEDVARAVVELIKTAKTGQSYSIDGGKFFESPKEKQYVEADFIRKFEIDDHKHHHKK